MLDTVSNVGTGEGSSLLPKFYEPGGIGLAALIFEIAILYYSRAAIDLLHSEVLAQEVTPSEVNSDLAIQFH